MEKAQYYKDIKSVDNQGNVTKIIKKEHGKMFLEIMTNRDQKWNMEYFRHPKIVEQYIDERKDDLIEINKTEVDNIIAQWN